MDIIKRAKEILSHYEKNDGNIPKPVNEQLLFIFDEKKENPVKKKLSLLKKLK